MKIVSTAVSVGPRNPPSVKSRLKVASVMALAAQSTPRRDAPMPAPTLSIARWHSRPMLPIGLLTRRPPS